MVLAGVFLSITANRFIGGAKPLRRERSTLVRPLATTDAHRGTKMGLINPQQATKTQEERRVLMSDSDLTPLSLPHLIDHLENKNNTLTPEQVKQALLNLAKRLLKG
jgi:hypothetical protein